MKHLLPLLLVFVISAPLSSSAQDAALYSKAAFEEIFKSHNEITVLINGFDYQYKGSWLSNMEIVGEYTLVFSRGDVVHSYDLRKVVMVQEERGWVKLWMK